MKKKIKSIIMTVLALCVCISVTGCADEVEKVEDSPVESKVETIEVSPIGLVEAMTCPESCDAGKFGYYCSEGSYGIYFSAKEHDEVYLLETEGGRSVETTASESEIYGRDNTPWNYDTELEHGTDEDGDGYISFTISVYVGDGYEPVSIIKGKKDENIDNSNSAEQQTADSKSETEIEAESESEQYINPKTEASFEVLNTCYNLKKESYGEVTSFEECEFVSGITKAFNSNGKIVFTEGTYSDKRGYLYDIETKEATVYDLSPFVSGDVYYSEGNFYCLNTSDKTLKKMDSEGNITQVELPSDYLGKIYILNNGTVLICSEYEDDYIIISNDFNSVQNLPKPQVTKAHGIVEDSNAAIIVGSYGTKIFAGVDYSNHLYCFDTDTFTWNETDIFYDYKTNCYFSGKYGVILNESKDSYSFYNLETFEVIDTPDITGNKRLLSVFTEDENLIDLASIEEANNTTAEEKEILKKLVSNALSDIYSLTDEQWDMVYDQIPLSSDWSLLTQFIIGNTSYSNDDYLTGVYERHFYTVSFSDNNKVPKLVQYLDDTKYPSATSCMIDHEKCVYKDSYGIFIHNLETGDEETVLLFNQ